MFIALALLALMATACAGESDDTTQISVVPAQEVVSGMATVQASETDRIIAAQPTPAPLEVEVTRVVEQQVEVTRVVEVEVEREVEVPVTTTVYITNTAPLTLTGEIVPGSLAMSKPTDENLHEASPVGYVNSEVAIVCELWGPVQLSILEELGLNGNIEDRFVVNGDEAVVSTVEIVPPSMVAWYQDFYGGTCFWLEDEPLAEVAVRHTNDLVARDGVKPLLVVLSDDLVVDETVLLDNNIRRFTNSPFLGCMQDEPVLNQVRQCVAVGERPAFSVEVGHPLPGYYPEGEFTEAEVAEEVTEEDSDTEIVEEAAVGEVAEEVIEESAEDEEQCGDTKVVGPAIFNDGARGAAIRVDSGESVDWTNVGNCWPLDSQSALVAAWPDHVENFGNQYPNAPIYTVVDGELVPYEDD